MCLQSFLLENLMMVLSLFLPSRWQACIFFPEIFTPIWWRILQKVSSLWSRSTEEGVPTNSAHSRRAFTFLTTMISDSSFLKLQCISLILLIRVFMVLFCCLWVFKISLMSRVAVSYLNIAIFPQYKLQP